MLLQPFCARLLVPLFSVDVRAARACACLLVQGAFQVAWVRINDRSANMGCLSTKGMYQRPRHDVVSVHNLKERGGLQYLYGLFHDGVAHSGENCTRWVYYDNCRDLGNANRKVTDWCKKNCDGAECPNTLNPGFVDKPVRAEDMGGGPRPEPKRCKPV